MGKLIEKMKLLLTGLIFSLILTGCSYNTDFFIFNKAEQTLLVEYQTKDFSDSKPFVTDPRIVEFDQNMDIIEIKKAYEFEFEGDTKTIRCKLLKGQALWIGRDLNFTLTNEKEAKILNENLKYLKIHSTKKQIYATDSDIIGLFKTFNTQTVGIEIK